MASFLILKPTTRRAGNVYVNDTKQIALNNPVSYENCGIDAAMMKAIDQYIGTINTQMILPFMTVSGGALSGS
jgi:hypothetical protein